MKREDMIQNLKKASPVVTQVTFSDDMGYEFSAVVPDGVIYPIPGMLIDYSGGEWPPNLWECAKEEEYTELWRSFLVDETWDVTRWEDLSDEEIEEWFEEVCLQSTDEESEYDLETAVTPVIDINFKKNSGLNYSSEFEEYTGTETFSDECESRIRNFYKGILILEKCLIHNNAIYWIWRGQRESSTPESWPVHFRIIVKDSSGDFNCYGLCAPSWGYISADAIVKHIEGTQLLFGGMLHKIE